jgi:hypothetical protein
MAGHPRGLANAQFGCSPTSSQTCLICTEANLADHRVDSRTVVVECESKCANVYPRSQTDPLGWPGGLARRFSRLSIATPGKHKASQRCDKDKTHALSLVRGQDPLGAGTKAQDEGTAAVVPATAPSSLGGGLLPGLYEAPRDEPVHERNRASCARGACLQRSDRCNGCSNGTQHVHRGPSQPRAVRIVSR